MKQKLNVHMDTVLIVFSLVQICTSISAFAKRWRHGAIKRNARIKQYNSIGTMYRLTISPKLQRDVRHH